MRKKVLIRGPILSRSGYGEHARFVYRSLKKYDERFDIYVINTNWGMCGWIWEDSEERREIDDLIKKTVMVTQDKSFQYDISVQVTIPNEFERLAPINIGVTAGIEVSKASAVWLERCNLMNSIVTVSEFSKEILDKTNYDVFSQSGEEIKGYRIMCPIEVAGYPVPDVSDFEEVDLSDLKHDFCFLVNSQWGPRKNMESTVRWFIEQCFNMDVGLILKTTVKNNSVMDREFCTSELKKALKQVPSGRKCGIYLLHGEMTEKEMIGLYKNEKVKCLINLSHGEGFGLPEFEMASVGKPIITSGWGGHNDFLYKEEVVTRVSKSSKKKKKRTVRKPMFREVNYDIKEIGEEVVWPGVLEKGTMWAYPREDSFKESIGDMMSNYDKWLAKATELKSFIDVKFEKEKQLKRMADLVCDEEDAEIESWIESLKVDEIR